MTRCGTINSNADPWQVTVTAEAASGIKYQTWTLDALGNWKDLEFKEGSTVKNDTREHNIANQIKTIAVSGQSTRTPAHDKAGNLKDDGIYLYDYDCENRLTRVRTSVPTPVLIAEYSYNALGWRARKTVSNSGGLNGAWRLIYNSAWQLLETRAVSGESQTTDKQFIHAGPGAPSVASSLIGSVASPYLDDHLALLTNSGGSWTTHTYHADAQFNTMAMTGSSATVIERALYEPYGTASLTDSGGSPISTSAIGNALLRQGIPRDWETGNDENRYRWYSRNLGRWGQRDPLYSNAGQSMAVDAPGARMVDVPVEGDGPTNEGLHPLPPLFKDRKYCGPGAAMVAVPPRSPVTSSGPGRGQRLESPVIGVLEMTNLGATVFPLSRLDPHGLESAICHDKGAPNAWGETEYRCLMSIFAGGHPCGTCKKGADGTWSAPCVDCGGTCAGANGPGHGHHCGVERDASNNPSCTCVCDQWPPY